MNLSITRTLVLFAAVATLGSCKEKKVEQPTLPVKVKTMTVGTSQADGSQTYSGTVEEESGASFSFATIGTLQSLNIAEGQFVRKGQLVGVLDATSVRNAYESAVATKEQALDAQKRMKMLHDNGSLPEIKWVEVETQVRQAIAAEQIAKKGLGDTKLYAPFSGYVTKKNVEVGSNVAPGVPIATVVKIENVKVKVNVPEEEISGISIGTPLRISVAALGNATITGRVTEKSVSADPLSRSYEVKALIANPQQRLLPGMIADVTVSTGGHASATIALPANIVQLNADNRTFVWTVEGGKARKTYVTTSGNIGDKVVIASGLAQGDKIIVEGQQKVSSGMTVSE